LALRTPGSLGRVAAELVANRQPGGVVIRRVDAVAAGQALDALKLEVALDSQVFLRDEGIELVCIENGIAEFLSAD
jgi:hypothetical protein